MDTTSPTLLGQVKNPNDTTAWDEFARVYRPILVRYAEYRGMRRDEAEDIAQDCMQKLLLKMRDFEYSRAKGRFKSFLFRIVSNDICNRRRRKEPLPSNSAIEAAAEELEVVEDPEWRRLVLKRYLQVCLERIEQHFCSPTVIAAFKLYVMCDLPVEEVCKILGVEPGYVHNSKRRVLERLKNEIEDRFGDVD